MDWRAEVLDQLDLYWEHNLTPRLGGLTDDEYFWEPVKDCWSVRTAADGRATLDGTRETPEPPPVTTIAWRLTHVAFQVLAIRTSTHFGDGSLTMATAQLPVSADAAVAALRAHYQDWRDAVSGLDKAALERPIGEAEGPWGDRPMATLMLHVNREVMHHGAEVALLRDLHRAHFS
ncbi:DinB family protein [Dactylosporangium sp. NPDC005555]|uniref:DinB family protein n=1 Tax=Dactylosporangium sp. NPDC005555 TaxID=3154889 RepID=UPI0033B0897E